MNFQEFWKKLQVELKQEKKFETLKYKRKFKAYLEYNKNEEYVVRVMPESGKIRGPIPSNEFKGIWNDVKKYSNETRFVNKDGRLGSFLRKNGERSNSMNMSYILKLVQHIVKNQKMN